MNVRPVVDHRCQSDHQATTPYLMLDVDAALSRYRSIRKAFGPRAVHYAVKANPHPVLVAALVVAGSRFDVASRGEVDLCLGAGADPAHLVYSNPMKRRSDIDHAYGLGVRLFVADSLDEVVKVSAAAPGCDVLVRLATTGGGSDWPLSGKFGCSVDEAVSLLVEASARGLGAAGVAFHVGSQQRDPRRWDPPIAAAATVFSRLRERGMAPWLLDIGGGLPAAHDGDHPAFDAYPATIRDAIRCRFPTTQPELIVEPGRGIVGDAGTIVSEVLGGHLARRPPLGLPRRRGLHRTGRDAR